MKIESELIKFIDEEHSKCTGCRACMSNCPMLYHHTDNPKNLLNKIRNESYHSNITSGDDVHKLPFTCTLCGFCDHICNFDVSLESVFFKLKETYVKDLGYDKSMGKIALEFHQNASFSSLFSSSLNTKNVQIQKVDNKIEKNVIFFPGCSPSSHSPGIIEHVYSYLKTSYKNENSNSDKLRINLDIYLSCCGNPTKSVGQTERYNNFDDSLKNDFDKNDIDEIIVLCMNCYRTLTKAHPSIKVTTLWEKMAAIGLPKDYSPPSDLPTFALHDPCPTREYPQIHNSVRRVLSLMNIEFEEFRFNKERTVCCGSGAMLNLVDLSLANHHKLKRALQTKRKHILTYCQECTESLEQEEKHTIHMLDLLFGEDQYINWNQSTRNTLVKWLNRYKTKRFADSQHVKLTD